MNRLVAAKDRPARPRYRTFLLLSPIGLVVLGAVFWFALTQPLFWRVHSSTVVNVDPARLERHVRMLSEAFVPRDWTHPVNLDLAAAYIKKEFEVAGGTVSEQTVSDGAKDLSQCGRDVWTRHERKDRRWSAL